LIQTSFLTGFLKATFRNSFAEKLGSFFDEIETALQQLDHNPNQERSLIMNDVERYLRQQSSY